MLAALLVKPGEIALQEMPVIAPSKGEVLVKIKASLTCGTDLKAYLRGHPMIPMPGVFGHEFSGVIAEAGKDAADFKAGDEIMAVHSAPCLRCRYCKKRLFNLCEDIMNTKVLGAFAEYILLPSHIVKQNLFRKPENLSFEEAAFLEPLSCVVHGMSSLDIKKNDRVLIIGAGPIGLLHLLLAKLKGAKVMVNGRNRNRLAFAKRLGADMTASVLELISGIEEFSEGLGVDYVFECTGQADVWEKSVTYVRRGGTVVLFGGCKSGTKVIYDTYRLHYDEISLKGAFHFTPEDVKNAYNLLRHGKIKVSKLISGRYALKNTEKAFRKLMEGNGIKNAVIP